MNILVLNYEFPPIGGGAAPVAFDIARLLVEQGNKVTVVTMKFKGTKKDEVVEGINIHRVPCIRNNANVCHPWEQLSYIISSCCYLSKHLKRNQYDVCHTHFIVPTGVVALYLKKKFKLNYIITSHGSDVIGHNDNRFKLLYQLIKKPWISIVTNARLVTAPATHLVEKMKNIFPSGNYMVIPNGIFTKDYKNLRKEKYILVMSRIQETKGIQTIIRAFSKLGDTHWKLKIAGEGPYKHELEDLTHTLKLESKIEFLGWISGKSEEHINLLGKAAIFASASWFEAQPVSLLEAMASGCYILASDIPAHRQLLKDENIFGAEELAEKLKEAIKLESFSKDYALSEYDWKNIINKYEKILEMSKTVQVKMGGESSK